MLLHDGFFGAEGFHIRVVNPEAAILETGDFGSDFLILGEHLLDGRIGDLQCGDAAHDLVVGELGDLFVLGLDRGDLEALGAHLLFDGEEDLVGGLHGILDAVGVKVLNVVFDADALGIVAEFIDFAALLGDFLLKLDERAGDAALLLLDAAALVFLGNAVGDVCGLLAFG